MHDNAFKNTFSIIFCLKNKDLCCNQCCSLELYLGRLAKIVIDFLASDTMAMACTLAYWTAGLNKYLSEEMKSIKYKVGVKG